MNSRWLIILAFVSAAGCTALGAMAARQAHAAALAKKRVFEMRVYHTDNAKMAEAMHARFRDHTCKLFKKHGMDLIGFWIPQDDKTKLVYILGYPDRDAAKKSWQTFMEDPEWKKVYAESPEKAGGKIVTKVDSTFMEPADYSEIQ